MGYGCFPIARNAQCVIILLSFRVIKPMLDELHKMVQRGIVECIPQDTGMHTTMAGGLADKQHEADHLVGWAATLACITVSHHTLADEQPHD